MDPTSHTYFLLQPIFLRGFSGSLHLALLIVLFASWVCTKIRINRCEAKNLRPRNSTKLLYYKQALICCLGLSLLSLVLCFLNHFYWYPSGWSNEKVITLLDSVLKTLAWLVVSAYLYLQFPFSSEPKYPFLLSVWWGFFFLISCYSLVVDYVYYKNHQTVPIHFFVSDVIFTIGGLFLCYVGFLGKTEGADSLLQEPLLNANDSTNNVRDSGESNLGENSSLFSNASFFSILTFSWMSSLVATGYKKTLDLVDIPQLAGVDSVKGSFPILRNKIESDSGSNGQVTTFTLLKALLCTTWKEIILTAFFSLMYSVASYVGPYLIDTFVQYLNGNREYKTEGYLLVSTFFIAKLVECFAQRHWHFRLQQAGIRAKAALIAMIYSKGLTLSCQSKQAHMSGDIINFVTVDAERIGDFYWYIHDPWLLLVQIGLALVILYKDIGLASIAAFAATVLVMLANVPLGSLQEKFQDKLMKSKDNRMKATSEVLRNMRILKLQGWEMNFLSKIIELRKIEARWLKKYVYTWAITMFFFWGAPTFVSVVAFGACILMGIPLESGKILSALATFSKLQGPIYNLPDTISFLAQIKVSLDRIASFLRLEDLQPDVIEKIPRGGSNTAIEIVEGNFCWDLSSNNPILEDINFSISHGMRVAVCGTVGSGKSTLLSCILGEVPKISGLVKVSGTKAYVAQSPWIQSGKIEDNILFGKEMDRERYEKVVEACSLQKDLEILPFGDQTVIGERGINLSGGQKQRIQIARALYRDADIYLLDDPFSAVDAHTGSHIFKECILRLLDSKTVIYITHQVEFLRSADIILVMKDGRITQAGKYNDILNSGSKFMELVGAHEKALSTLDYAVSSVNEEGTSTMGRDNQVEEAAYDTVGGLKQGQLVQEEEREKGGVGFSIYWKYITTGYRGAFVPFILLAQILFQLLQIGSNYWIAWASPVTETEASIVEISLTLVIIVYVALAIASSLCILARTILLAIAGFETATLLFNKVHLCIFRAPMSFFDSTPSGRILNRASTDQSAVDLNIPNKVGAVANYVIQLLGIFAVMSAVSWKVLLVFIPVIAICIWYQQYFIPSIREMARLSGVCKAPVIQHFAETISGSTTIRSFDDERRFQDTSMKLLDGYSRPNFHKTAASERLCFHLDMLSCITFAFSLVFLISLPQGTIDPSIAGLAVTYGLSLNTIQVRLIWGLCDMENRIISVERILQYTCIPSEPPLIIESNRPEPHWPSHGEVDIRNLKVRYARHLPLVLRGLTCTFHGEMKTGIVGRTGSGKSTLIQTLFRIIEPTAGEILIDGINISSIGLHDLRSRLSIIPQDPTMFDGTIRSNLDPLEEYTDGQIWEVLDKCQLGDEVRKKENKLDSIVNENGENWSVGQRQLVCLGRVLLKKSKVLVLDEATASVDTVTDNMILQTLRQHFSNSTVITIAHRITSVLDSDMVLLLDNGLVEEYDSPTKLLGNKSSSFARLVAEYSLRSNSSFG